jgi:hypothetical protein
MIRVDWKKHRNKWTLLITVFLFALHLAAPCAYSQTSPSSGAQSNAAGDANGVEELARILVKKGLLKEDELAAMMEKKGEPGFSALAALTDLLKAKGVLTPDEAGKVARKAEEAPARPVILYSERDRKDMEKMAQEMTAEIKKDVKAQVKAEVKEEVMQETKKEIQTAAAPEWTKRIRFGGDIRLRYQGEYYDSSNADFAKPSDPTQIMNSSVDRDRFRVRARVGMTADVNDSAEVGVRLVTGTTSDPVSTNQTLGTYYNKYGVTFDLAYLKFKPNVPGLTVWGGRIPNPWLYTDMVWDSDVNFDGFAANYTGKFSPKLDGFFTAGAFPLQEVEFSQSDKWLYGGQLGLNFKPQKEILSRTGLAYYYYKNTQGRANNPSFPGQFDYTAPLFMQKGNTLFDIDPGPALKLALASKYELLNITSTLDIGFWDPIRVVLIGDYVKNLGYDRSQVAQLTGNPAVKENTYGYQVGLAVGYPTMNRFKDWKLYTYYKYLGADAVLDAFTDSDFHGGGTNAKGWILGGEFGLTKNIWLSARWMSTNEIKGPPLAIDSFFLDLNARF